MIVTFETYVRDNDSDGYTEHIHRVWQQRCRRHDSGEFKLNIPYAVMQELMSKIGDSEQVRIIVQPE